jgi:saccharopine dehydrogenase-like NADP-dependent oxidoreductase
MTVHWLGAGLSSGAGIRELARSGRPLTLWNRTVEKARAALAGLAASHVRVERFDKEALRAQLAAGDAVVSMLPAPMHPEIAGVCLERKAHLVTTSYLSPAMKALDAEARALGLSFINEAGLDPGIDHLFAHKLVAEYRASARFDPKAELQFISYCGGIPEIPGEFKYKFSWSPVGVLRALTNPARCVEDGAEKTTARCWDSLSRLDILGERFETYPNRDSIPYLAEYGFEKDWNVRRFVRGTIRVNGWASAWKPIFDKIPTATPQELERVSAELWEKHQYRAGERDRVVLYVELKTPRWSRFYALDERGEGADTAMTRLVSLPAVYAVEAALDGRAPKGVSGAPKDAAEIDRWLNRLEQSGVRLLGALQAA